MKPDGEGFLYPVANADKCINCGLCDRVCPVASAGDKAAGTMPACYAARSCDEGQRQESSSGGIFSLLAEQVLKLGGRVYGAAFDHRMQVQHIWVESKEKLGKLRGSKYVQSRIGNIYRAVKQDLQTEKTVLFTGTACQIAGLKAFLGREYANLYTVDVLCHGVPSAAVWEKYLTWQQHRYGDSPVCAANMRCKDSGWKRYSVKLDFENEKSYSRLHGDDVFMHAFLSDLCLRPSCHECRFKSLDRPSDLTLGDAWGIDKLLPDMDDTRGTSLVLVHSRRGEELLQSVADRMEYRQVDTDRALPPTAYSRRSAPRNPDRERFFEAMNSPAWEKEFNRLEAKNKLSMMKRRIKTFLKGK